MERKIFATLAVDRNIRACVQSPLGNDMPLIGIDLGTTFSAVAHLDQSGTPTTIPNAEGELTTPSVVLFEKDGEVVVGRTARRAALAEPGRTADYIKRSMGEPFYPRLINGKQMTPVFLSSLILKKLKQDAERKIGRIDGAVITVPAYFDEARRQATASAGRIAGMNVIDIINEPTSAALAYAYKAMAAGSAGGPAGLDPDASAGGPQTVLVYDLGGGTFDVTVLRISGAELRVVATTGDVKLGGRDWDERLFSLASDAFLDAHDGDPRADATSQQNLMLACEEAKRVLSQRKQTDIVVNHAGKTLAVPVTREQFEEMTADILYRTESRVGRVLKQTGLSWDKRLKVLAVGGSTRMPQVVQMLKRVTGKEPNCTLSPDEAVAHGAAIHAAVTALNSAPQGLPVIGASTEAKYGGLPATKEKSKHSFLGYFKKRVSDLLLSIHTTNVNAHSLGVVVYSSDKSERVSVLIPNDSPLPHSASKRFGTLSENQKSVIVRVVEGESSDPDECVHVGACQIQKLPAGLPKGSPVEVTFSYDSSCRLEVKAMEVNSGARATAVIQRTPGLPAGNTESSLFAEVAGTLVS
jgi:molecular chaperone DnaK